MTARDAEAEQEVDLGRYWHAVVARWWLLLLGLIAGALIGYAVSLGGTQQFKASATIYLGTPYSIIGSVPLQNAQTNPATVNTLIHSEEFVDAAAAAAGTSPDAIRSGISSKAISTGVGLTAAQRASANPLVRVSVTASTRRRATRAANSLARQVVARLAPLSRQKIELLKQRVASDKQELDTIRRLSAGAGDATLKAVLGIQLNDVLQDQLQAEQLLAQALQVERPALLARAVATKTTARSRRNATVVGGFIGLLIGLIAALAWEPVARRTRR
jgi:capsular polysaccharide biosynthesis protein